MASAGAPSSIPPYDTPHFPAPAASRHSIAFTTVLYKQSQVTRPQVGWLICMKRPALSSLLTPPIPSFPVEQNALPAMLVTTLAALLAGVCVPPCVCAMSFSSSGVGLGGSLGLSTFGVSSTSGDVTAAGSGASGGPHNAINMHLSPFKGDSDEEEGSMASPEALDLPFFVLPAFARQQDAAGETDGQVKGGMAVKQKVNIRTGGMGTHPARVCWVVSKTCCYEEVQTGYECKDFYEYKYARCHPVIDYVERCSRVTEEPAEHPKPMGRTKTEETVIKNYDANYGPHVDGYPPEGESEFYETPTIPHRPYSVPGAPHPPPHTFEGVHNGPSGAGETRSIGGDGYTGAGQDEGEQETEVETRNWGGEEGYNEPVQTTTPTVSPVAITSESQSYQR